MPTLPTLIEAVLQWRKPITWYKTQNTAEKSAIQQTSYITAVAEKDLYSINDTEVYRGGKAFSRKTANT